MAQDNDYVNYVGDTSMPFYNYTTNNKDLKKFEVPELSDLEHYNHQEDPYWSYYILKDDKGPDQGWKIHVSANVKDSQKLLTTVFTYLVDNLISFKFVPSEGELETKNSKYGERAASGKFITVYPENEQQFVELLSDLKKITDKFLPAPYILNDMQWQQSHVFFRYGAFKSLRVNKDGRIIDAIRDLDGNPVEDLRVPYYAKPDFVTEPQQVLDENTFAPEREFDNIKQYELKSAVHFSNAGGVYVARKHGADSDVIIKEGNPHSGLDANGLDGATRLNREYEYLDKLRDVPQVVDVHDYFESWNHAYLTEEPVEGMTIDNFLAKMFPFSNEIDVKGYIETSFGIIDELVKMVEAVHEKGIAIGDLQPANVIITSMNNPVTIKLIDLESANEIDTKYKPGLMTPGFMTKNAKTYGAADWFAVDKIAHYLFMPIEPVSELDPDIIDRQIVNIKRKFGVEVAQKMDEIDKLAGQYVDLRTQSQYYHGKITNPTKTLSPQTVPDYIEGLSKGIIDNFDYDFPGLIRGDIDQYDNDAKMLSVANGGYGALMALDRVGKLEITPKIDEWIRNSFSTLDNLNYQFDEIGLFDGLSGIACVLYELGYQEQAIKMMKKLNPRMDANEVSVYSGLAGVGLAYLSFYQNTNDSEFLKNANDIADYLIKKFDDLQEQQQFDNDDIGVIDGWLGAVLLIWKMGLVQKDSVYQSETTRLFNSIIGDNIAHDEQGIFIQDFSRGFERLIPYFNSGISGVGWLMLEIAKDDSSFLTGERKEIIGEIVKTNDAYCTYMGGIFDGYAGLLLFDEQARKFEKPELKKDKLANLNDYLIAQKDEILMPGRFGYKCSMDVSSGTAGILLALGDFDSGKSNSWFPTINTKPFS